MVGHYREVDPVGKRSVRITADRAGALQPEAWMFYRPLPSGNVKPADLLGIALHGSAGELARLVIAGLPGGLIKLLPALALGYVANHVASGGKRRSALRRGRDLGGVRPARRTAAPVSKHGDDAARGALGVAGRSRLLGPPHAPSAEHSAPPSGRRSGHVGHDVPESSRRLAGGRGRQPAVHHFSCFRSLPSSSSTIRPWGSSLSSSAWLRCWSPWPLGCARSRPMGG